jgi:hypothetical protein
VTVINKEHGANARGTLVSFYPSAIYGSGEFIYLNSPDNDVAATTGVTLGGAEIKPDGTWNGNWHSLGTLFPAREGQFPIGVEVPPATAAVVRFKLK